MGGLWGTPGRESKLQSKWYCLKLLTKKNPQVKTLSCNKISEWLLATLVRLKISFQQNVSAMTFISTELKSTQVMKRFAGVVVCFVMLYFYTVKRPFPASFASTHQLRSSPKCKKQKLKSRRLWRIKWRRFSFWFGFDRWEMSANSCSSQIHVYLRPISFWLIAHNKY